MNVDKESILRHYRQVRDEEFSTINLDELTDDGRAAYYEEKTRRSSPEYAEKREAEKLARDTAIKISTEKREAKKEYYKNVIMKAGFIIVPILGIVSGIYCSQAVDTFNRAHDMGPLQWWGFVNFWGLMIMQRILKQFRYVAVYATIAFVAAIATHWINV